MNVLVLALDADRVEVDGAEALVIAPALNSRLRHWLSDDDDARRKAGDRAAACVHRLRRRGVTAHGVVGDADPLQAIADALPTFAADKIVIAARSEPTDRLAREVASRVCARFALPTLCSEDRIPRAA
jgi:hypothetical protein